MFRLVYSTFFRSVYKTQKEQLTKSYVVIGYDITNIKGSQIHT